MFSCTLNISGKVIYGDLATETNKRIRNTNASAKCEEFKRLDLNFEGFLGSFFYDSIKYLIDVGKRANDDSIKDFAWNVFGSHASVSCWL